MAFDGISHLMFDEDGKIFQSLVFRWVVATGSVMPLMCIAVSLTRPVVYLCIVAFSFLFRVLHATPTVFILESHLVLRQN